MWYRWWRRPLGWVSDVFGAAAVWCTLGAAGVALLLILWFFYPESPIASLPRVGHHLIGCASSRQFLVEFRLYNSESEPPIRGLDSRSLGRPFTLTVDGEALGYVPWPGPGIRRFLCEGNHEALIQFARPPGDTWEEHRVIFAVSRTSLFHGTQWARDENEPATCVTDAGCSTNVGLELSPFDPEEDRPYWIDQARR
jgi:hypothetical protein